MLSAHTQWQYLQLKWKSKICFLNFFSLLCVSQNKLYSSFILIFHRKVLGISSIKTVFPRWPVLLLSTLFTQFNLFSIDEKKLLNLTCEYRVSEKSVHLVRFGIQCSPVLSCFPRVGCFYLDLCKPVSKNTDIAII